MSKIKAYRLGIFAEIFCIIFLFFKGYGLLERRFKTHLGEIDLIFTKGKKVIFVEVKARNSDVKELVTTKQQQRIVRAASLFLAKRQKFANADVRFDLIFFRPPFFIKHHKDAWRA